MSERILERCRNVVKPGDRIVAAVSGGADSVCLAHALYQVCRQNSAWLMIAHINHQLRGEEADADARFVCAWSARLGVPRIVVRIRVPRRSGQSLQDVARKERYRALTRICIEHRAAKLVTAHHADDQVETFLLNLLRGSGSKGLQGIPGQRALTEQITLLRPLLDVSRAEIEAYCRKHGLQWRTDASNDSLDYLRNRIRHHLLPILRQYNPGIDGVLLNTINNLRMDEEVLAAQAEKTRAEIETDSPLPFAARALLVAPLAELPPALQNRVILQWLPPGCETRHIGAVLKLLWAKTGASIDLPGGKRVYRLHDSIALGARPEIVRVPAVRVHLPGYREAGALAVRTALREFPGSRKFWLPRQVEWIEVSSRKPGDYFRPPGGGKKLKEYMIDRKIPRWLRESYPVVRAGGEIFWVVGLAHDPRFTTPGPDKRAVYIKVQWTGGL